MVIQTAHFTRDDNYWVVYILTAFLQSIIHILLKLIYICAHFLTVNNRRYGLCYVKKNYTTVYFPWILHASWGKFSKIVSKCFFQAFSSLSGHLSLFLDVRSENIDWSTSSCIKKSWRISIPAGKQCSPELDSPSFHSSSHPVRNTQCLP